MLTVSVLLGLLFSLVVILLLDQSKSSEVFELVEFELPCLPAVAFELLKDLSAWQAWMDSPHAAETRTRLSTTPTETVSPADGNVLGWSLFGTQIHPFTSLEFIQVWQDRRLQLITQDLSAGRIRNDRLDFQQSGAFCRVQWRARIVRESGVPLSRPARLKFRKLHKLATRRMMESVGYSNKRTSNRQFGSVNVAS